jgi:paraquat-inducible protein B
MSETLLPRAREVFSRWPGLVWAVPLAALIVIVYLAFSALANPGVEAVIVFKDSAGATPNDTKVIYRGLQVGHVTKISLDKDGHSVDIRVRLDGRVKPALLDTTEFWLEGANFSLTDLSSLKAAVAGVTIDMASGVGGRPAKRFIGLDERPAVMPDAKGTSFWLQADNLGALRAGSNVMYRGMIVGKIANVDVEGPRQLRAQAFVRAPYDQLVRPGSLFWVEAPFKISLSGAEIGASFDPSAALGAVTFETPDEFRGQAASPPGSVYPLYADQTHAFGEGVGPQVLYRAIFPAPAGTLNKGAPVNLGGFQVGAVTDVSMTLDPATGLLMTPVTLAIEPLRLHLVGVKPPANGDWRPVVNRAMASLVAKGYRLQMSQAPPLVGAAYVTFNQMPKAAAAHIALGGDYPEIPTAASADLAAIGDKATILMDHLDSLPLQEIGENVRQLTGHLNHLVGSPKMEDSLTHLNDTLDQADKMIREVRPQIAPLAAKLRDAADQIDQMAASANALMSGQGAGQDEGLPGAVKELTNAARSMRALADEVQRHPEVLLKGKSK